MATPLANIPEAQCFLVTLRAAFLDSRVTFVQREHIIAELKVIQKKHFPDQKHLLPYLPGVAV